MAKCLFRADIPVCEAIYHREPGIMLLHGRGSPSFLRTEMAREEHQNKPLAARVAWPLLVLTAALQAHSGLWNVAYLFMGVGYPGSGRAGWVAAAMAGLQVVAAVAAFVLATRRDLRGTTIVVAGSLMLGWLSTVPAAIDQGLDFYGDDKVTPVIFVISPLIAITAATLAWRNTYPIVAALIASAMTFVGILFVIAFGIAIAIHGF
jgi:hypothetical protein